MGIFLAEVSFLKTIKCIISWVMGQNGTNYGADERVDEVQLLVMG